MVRIPAWRCWLPPGSCTGWTGGATVRVTEGAADPAWSGAEPPPVQPATTTATSKGPAQQTTQAPHAPGRTPAEHRQIARTELGGTPLVSSGPGPRPRRPPAHPPTLGDTLRKALLAGACQPPDPRGAPRRSCGYSPGCGSTTTPTPTAWSRQPAPLPDASHQQRSRRVDGQSAQRVVELISASPALVQIPARARGHRLHGRSRRRRSATTSARRSATMTQPTPSAWCRSRRP
jgi:hypothetical protein